MDTDSSKLYYLLRYFENPVLLILLLFTTPYFIHHLTNDEKSRSKNIIIASIASVLILFNILFVLLESGRVENNWRIFIKDAIFLCIIFYCILIIARYYNKLEDSEEKKFFRQIVFLLLLLLPAIISDTFFLEHIRFKFFPIVYVIIGITFYNYYIKIIREGFHSNKILNLHNNIKKFPKDILANEYRLTQRESEVIELLSEGKSYLTIAEELFISVNTVKSHIKKSYQKLNVDNRMELAKLINKLTSQN